MSLCLGTKVPLRPTSAMFFKGPSWANNKHINLLTHWAKFRKNCGTFFPVKLPPLGLSLPLINKIDCSLWSGLCFVQSDTLEPVNEQILHSYGPCIWLTQYGNLTPLP